MIADFLYNPSHVGANSHCSSLMRTRRGDLYAVWYCHPGDHEYQDAQIILSRRVAGSETWEKPRSVFDKFSSSSGNPIIFEDPITEQLHLLFVLIKGRYWNDAIVHRASSSDAGLTWSEPEVLWEKRGLMVRHPPRIIAGGKYLLAAYDESSHDSLFFVGGAGNEWSELGCLKGLGLIQGDIVPCGDTIHVFLRPTDDPRNVWRSYSMDGGNVWASPEKTPLSCPLSGVAAFSLGEEIYVVHNDSETKRYPLSVTRWSPSSDEWGKPVHLETTEHEFSYPSFIATGNGSVYGLYTFNRRMTKYVSFDREELENGF